MKKLKHLVIPEDNSLKHGQVIAIEGMGDFVGKVFGRTKGLTKEQIDAMVNQKGAEFGQNIKNYLSKTLMNQGWVGKNIKLGEKTAVPCKVAFINGKPEPNPEKLITCLKGMLQAAEHVLKVLEPNTKLRQQMGADILRNEKDTARADSLYEANKGKLPSNLAKYYMQNGGKNVQYAVGQNPNDKESGFPVNIGKTQSVEFERYYSSHSAPAGCAIAAPTNQNAGQYAKYMLELVAIITQTRIDIKSNTVPFWEMYESDFDLLEHGDAIANTVFGGHTRTAVDPTLAVESIASELLTTMLGAI